MRPLALVLPALALAACTTSPDAAVAPPKADTVQLLAINDFHGNLEAPKRAVPVRHVDGHYLRVPAGGAAHLAGALDALDEGEALRVAAGDMIGASPLASALFLDEPTIDALDMMGLDYSALGNHEFDKGVGELLRLNEGGCEAFTKLTPCALDGDYDGADFTFLAANVFTPEGETLLPDAAIEQVGGRTIGIIGMPLAGVPGLVAPNLVDGLVFADEATTANALVPALKARGAEAIVLLIHEGGQVDGDWDDAACPGLSGAVVDMLDALDPAIGVVVSGHTHRTYSCQVTMPGGQGTRLLTSAGAYGTMVTDIRLKFAPDGGAYLGAQGTNIVVQGDAYYDRDGNVVVPSAELPRFTPDAEVEALVSRVVDKARPMAERVVGMLTGPVDKPEGRNPGSAGYLIADAQWAATADDATGNADFALMNSGGVRTGLDGGEVTYGEIFAMQPFQNTLMTVTLTGAQIRAAIEQGLADDNRVMPLHPSRQLAYAFDTSLPPGQRVTSLAFDGAPIEPEREYRVTLNNFIAYGGDGYSVFKQGRDATGAGTDVDALADWLANGADAPTELRVIDRTPRPQR